MSSDPFSDILRLTRARGVLSAGLRAKGRFTVRVEMHDGMKFNAITEGACFLDVDGHASYKLEKGDCFLLTRATPFTVGNDRSSKVLSAAQVFAHATAGFAQLDNGDGPSATFVGGRMTSDRNMEFLTSSLPAVILLRAGTATAEWIRGLLLRLEAEMAEARPGAEIICEEIMHMIFVEMIRSHASDGEAVGWIAALSDPQIVKALSAMHAEPGRNWRVADLASASGLSRSQFAERFARIVGEPPLEYLTRWRMTLAREALRDRTATIAKVANDVGYGSEAAFGAAFKRVYGTSPRRSVEGDRVVKRQHDAARLESGRTARQS
ncbi:AraC family transcriptional regulator (plasmid) [Agrobacterium sp. 33MFTa1.1]|uniref:AraC family transcriptional regulator n=1 Tax=unclassified Agrobacterium TaxID=2632611 RepID=UPI0009DC9DED|nr:MULTISPECIES: AraC family transcriptional regulator [unclassified Agrobacterium]QBJ16767.1 AraC family transcriptional regulator [Agrobacterium sp. 33MFTa1.1]